VPDCGDPVVIAGAPEPLVPTCASSDPTDPLWRTIRLEKQMRSVLATLGNNSRQIAEILRLINPGGSSLGLQAQIATLAARVTATEGATATNTANIATNVIDIAAAAASGGTNAADILTNAGDIATNAADIAAIEANLAEDSIVQGYVSAAAASAAITSTTYLNALANATLADSGVGSGNFTVDDTNKRITYTGATTKEFRALATLSFSTTANGQVASFRWAKNGTTDAQTEVDQKLTAAGTDVQALSLQGIFSLATNDYLELWGTLDVSAADTITVNFATMTVIDLQTGI
jgi:hypothetical protein